jgi:hypothetical protein
MRGLELRVLALEKSDQRRAEAALELLRKVAAAEPGAKLPDTAELEASTAKMRKAVAGLERKLRFRKPRRRP